MRTFDKKYDHNPELRVVHDPGQCMTLNTHHTDWKDGG